MLVPVKNHFASLLEEKQKQERRYISLAEVSHQTGISRKTLYKWQNDAVEHFNNDVIDKLCDYFGVALDELLERTPADPEPKQKTARK
jgi:DNA-binding Xre family transcriptional regulator